MEDCRSPPFVEKTRREHPGEIIEIWCQDESRFGQKGTVSAVWARRGTRPVVDKQTRYENLYVFGAVRPTTGDSHALLLPYVNILAMQTYLDSLSDHIGPGRHVVLVLDGAGWHSSSKLLVPPNMSLLPLPAYSPELNPAENLWGYAKEHYLCNRCFEDYDALLEAGQAAWNALTPDLIRSLCHRDWIDSLLI